MTRIVIPVKTLSAAKQRLAPVLDPVERAGLVLAMLRDLLGCVIEAGVGPVSVVTGDDRVADLARGFGAGIVREGPMRGYNPAAALGLHHGGAGNVCVLPGDLPLAHPEEIVCLCAAAEPGSATVRLAPNRSQDGTNGIFLSAPGLLMPDFGGASLARHCRAARAAGIEPVLIRSPGLASDIDTPADLRDLARNVGSGATAEFLSPIRNRLIPHDVGREVA